MLIRQFSLSVAADPNVLQLTFPNEQIPQPNLQSKSLNKTPKNRILFARALHTWSYAELIVIPSLHSWRFCLSSTPMKGEAA